MVGGPEVVGWAQRWWAGPVRRRAEPVPALLSKLPFRRSEQMAVAAWRWRRTGGRAGDEHVRRPWGISIRIVGADSLTASGAEEAPAQGEDVRRRCGATVLDCCRAHPTTIRGATRSAACTCSHGALRPPGSQRHRPCDRLIAHTHTSAQGHEGVLWSLVPTCSPLAWHTHSPHTSAILHAPSAAASEGVALQCRVFPSACFAE